MYLIPLLQGSCHLHPSCPTLFPLPPPGPGQETVVDLEASTGNQQPETTSYLSNTDLPGPPVSQPGPRGSASPLENLYPDRSQDAEPTFDRGLVLSEV